MTTSTTQTPVLSPSSVVYAPQVSSSRRSPIMNLLVMAGLVPEDLSDILSTPLNDSAVTKTNKAYNRSEEPDVRGIC